MKKYFSLVTGLLAIGTEVAVYLSLMEIPPFGKGDSDIIWGLPFFCVIVLGLAIPGLLTAISLKNGPQGASRFVAVGLILNGLSMAIPFLLLILGVIRAFL